LNFFIVALNTFSVANDALFPISKTRWCKIV